MGINTTLNYSPNFDRKKRKFKQIKFIIFHYTGMKNEKVAIKRLTDSKSKVSSHYFIKYNGKVITLVPELYISWHAGISSFQNKDNCNDFSIGIELEGSEDDIFEDIQYEKLSQITSLLMQEYTDINKENIKGHSDVAPGRKTDPGNLFDWDRYLSNV